LTKRHREPLPLIPDGAYVDHLMPMVLLALHTGLRRGELFSLEWRDIDFLHNLLTVRAAAAKGAKTRHVPLNAAARDVLQRWQKQQKKATGQKELAGFVFPGKAGNRLDNISSSWEKLVTDAKLDDFTFHDLRHTFATRALQKGADIVTLSRLMGHSSLKMTLRYAHTSDAELRAAVDRLHTN
jgi:integrase